MKPRATLTQKMQETMRPKSPAMQSSVSTGHTLPQHFLDCSASKCPSEAEKERKLMKEEKLFSYPQLTKLVYPSGYLAQFSIPYNRNNSNVMHLLPL